MRVNKRSNVPLYAQLKELISEKIELGDYAPGDQIPTELALCKEFDLSRPTVRQAVAELVTEGKLYIIKGKGTFVCDDSEKILIKNFSGFTFSSIMSSNLESKFFIDYKLISKIPEVVSRIFTEKKGDLSHGIYEIIWSESLAEQTFVYCKSYLPAVFFPNLIMDVKKRVPIIKNVPGKYSVVPTDTETDIFLRNINTEEMRYFDLPKGAYILESQSVILNQNQSLLEFSMVSIRADICTLNFGETRRK